MFNKRIIHLLFISLMLVFVACSEDSDDEPAPSSSNNNNQNTSLPSSIQGLTANMIFTAPQAGAPYTLDQEVNFTFSNNGQMEIDDDPAANDGAEIVIMSYSVSGSEYIWSDTQNGYDYALSLKSDNSINEINVSNSTGFLGQFIEKSSGSANLIAPYAGTYNVSNVIHGNHSRSTVIIDNNGNIDFDSGINLSYSDMASVSDQLDCCDGIWIDMNPYPSEPYTRVNLYIDPNTNQPNKIEYYPQYSGITGRVTVELQQGSGNNTSGNQLTVSGDTSRIGGGTFSPAAGVECTSCSSSQKFTWTEMASPNKVFSVEIFSNNSVILDFSASSAFAANGADLAALGIVWDSNAKTFSFTNTNMNEKFSQPGQIIVNGTLSY